MQNYKNLILSLEKNQIMYELWKVEEYLVDVMMSCFVDRTIMVGDELMPVTSGVPQGYVLVQQVAFKWLHIKHTRRFSSTPVKFYSRLILYVS